MTQKRGFAAKGGEKREHHKQVLRLKQESGGTLRFA